MFDNKMICQNCRGCCKFKKDKTYFAPIFNKDEINLIKFKGYFIDSFKPHKNSHDVFQIKLIENKKDYSYHVCPYLNENTHICKIYDLRPIDCKIWPLVIMKDCDAKKTLLAYSNSSCKITDKMNSAKLDIYIKELELWFDNANFIDTFRKYPDLIWNYESETIIIKELDIK
jgi:Fe-S-cluster containining protein